MIKNILLTLSNNYLIILNEYNIDVCTRNVMINFDIFLCYLRFESNTSSFLTFMKNFTFCVCMHAGPKSGNFQSINGTFSDFEEWSTFTVQAYEKTFEITLEYLDLM